MRCIALAESWLEYGPVVFVCKEDMPLQDELRRRSIMIAHLSSTNLDLDLDSLETMDVARKYGSNWIVIDGYHFNDQYEQTLSTGGCQVLALDDFSHCSHQFATLVLNQNYNANPQLYDHFENVNKCLLGIDYILLRSEFSRNSRMERVFRSSSKRILITLGGASQDTTLKTLIQQLMPISNKDDEIVVVTGHHAKIDPSYDTDNSCNLRILKQTQQIHRLMERCEMAIICGGGTLWELLSLGVPTLSFSRNPTQQEVCQQLHEIGALGHLGPIELAYNDNWLTIFQQWRDSAITRRDASLRASSLIQAGGSAKVISKMKDISSHA